MDPTRKALRAGATAAALALGGNDDGERQATGPDAARAAAAALRFVPGGTADAVERDSEKGTTRVAWRVCAALRS